MSAIADLVSFLLSTGIQVESVSTAVDLAQRHAVEQVEIHRKSGGFPPDTAAEKRRQWDREYRRRKRNSTRQEKPPLILTSFSEEILTEERKKEVSNPIRARARKRLSPLPENWRPPDIAYSLATECGTSVPNVEAIFRDYLKSSGKLYADHDAAFCNFVRNQRKFNGQNHGKTSDNSGSKIIQAADDLRRKVASFDGPSREDLGVRDGAGPAATRLLSHR